MRFFIWDNGVPRVSIKGIMVPILNVIHQECARYKIMCREKSWYHAATIVSRFYRTFCLYPARFNYEKLRTKHEPSSLLDVELPQYITK